MRWPARRVRRAAPGVANASVGPRSLRDRRGRARRPDEKHRSLRFPHDRFGVAAHHQSADTAPAVRAEHDEVGAELARLREDRVGNRPAQRLDEQRLQPESGLSRQRLRPGEGLAAVFAEALEQGVDVLRRRILEPGQRLRDRRVVDHVDRIELRPLLLGQADRRLEAAVRRRAAIDCDQDTFEHAWVPGTRSSAASFRAPRSKRRSRLR